jgi:hypothetical protein
VVLSYGSCKTPSQSKQVVYKPGLPKPTLTVRGPNLWYFICSIEHAKVYRWYYNGNLVAENSKNLFFAGTRLGEYYVEVNDGGECFVPSDKVVIPIVPIGIDNIYAGDRVYIYPNPTSGNIRITCTDKYTGKITVRIYNIDGSVVKELEIQKDHADLSEELDLAGFEAGLYILELLTDRYPRRSPFIIMK